MFREITTLKLLESKNDMMHHGKPEGLFPKDSFTVLLTRLRYRWAAGKGAKYYMYHILALQAATEVEGANMCAAVAASGARAAAGGDQSGARLSLPKALPHSVAGLFSVSPTKISWHNNNAAPVWK